MKTDTLRGDVKPTDPPADKPKVITYAQRRLAPESVVVAPPETRQVRFLRLTLITLVLVLTFEGLARKLIHGGAGTAIFFIKDFIILFMGMQIATKHKLPGAINFLSIAYLLLVILMLPCILSTASHDVILAAFGAKQYLLYPIVALSVFVVFRDATIQDINRFARLVAFLMIPCGLVAIIQTRLPASNWINMSVDGASLEDFSAGGNLRVSSTFSFVAQFCCFLNMQPFMLILAIYGMKKFSSFKKFVYLSTFPLLIISAYLTGSRGAVLGIFSMVVIALMLSLMRFEFGKTIRLAAIAAVLIAIVLAFQAMFPKMMATYSARENGQVLGVSSEMKERIWNAYFGWTDQISGVPTFGNGLGIMSNGADSLSAYARGFRIATWTETDFATTLFEGGIYLIFVWYGFRYFIIISTTARFLLQTKGELFVPGVCCQAFVILTGFVGTLEIQPPIAIWWYLGVGISVILWWRSLHPLASAEAPKVDTTPEYAKAALARKKALAEAAAAEKLTADRPIVPAPGTGPKVRGRSSYADRLHGRE